MEKIEDTGIPCGNAEDTITQLLRIIGEDPERGGLKETPKRVIKAWREWTAGYHQNPADVLKCFEDGGETYDEMLWERNLPFYSHCEHHLAPFFGTVTIAYIPKDRIVGISKFKRVADIYAKRLQVQERLTTQIADAIQQNLQPRGVGVIVRARHLCMESRGVSCQGQETVTSALRGVLRSGAPRAEFLSVANS